MRWLVLPLILALATAASAENKLYFGVKGNHRDWTAISGDKPKELANTPYLQKVYELATEPEFHAYLLRELQRTPGNVWITLVDDTLVGAHKVWPHASGRQFLISESWFTKYERARGPQATRGLLAHELAHTQDEAHSQHGAYGLDGIHSRTEVITQRAAMIEGWANYQALRFSPWQESAYRWEHLADRTKQEDHEIKAKYHKHHLGTFEDWMRVEAGVTRVLHALGTKTPGGREAISAAFDATNDGKVRTLPRMLREMAAKNPTLGVKYATLVDGATDYTATNDELIDLFGEGGRTYVRDWRKLQKP